MSDPQIISMTEIRESILPALVDRIINEVPFNRGYTTRTVYGIPRGGAIVASLLESAFPDLFTQVGSPGLATCIVDDIIDSGETMGRYESTHLPFFALIDKRKGCPEWIIFPWESSTEDDPAILMTRVLQRLGIDVTSESRRNTPLRFVNALREFTCHEGKDAVTLLMSACFKQPTNEMVIVRDIPFASTCEHHLLPFSGIAHVGYIPGPAGTIVGLSKIPRALEIHCGKLQMQERIAWDLAHDIEIALRPAGVGVVLAGKHSCMSCRGVRKEGQMVTSCLLGVLREDSRARSEFLTLIG